MPNLPQWVAAPPPSERSVDPLGFQVDQERIADLFVPDLTGNTNRARYFSFLCWAHDKTGGVVSGMRNREKRLVLAEFKSHEGEKSCGDVRGLGMVKERGGAIPRGWLKTSAWDIYRSSMEGLGLLSREGRQRKLTEDGQNLAFQYDMGRRRSPLLCEPGRIEKRRLEEALFGFDVGGRRRRQTKLFMRGFEGSHEALGDVLRRYKDRSPDGAEEVLWRAAVHELAVSALKGLFLAWYAYPPRNFREWLNRVGRKDRAALWTLPDNENSEDSPTAWSRGWGRVAAALHVDRRGGAYVQGTSAARLVREIASVNGGKPPRDERRTRQVAEILWRAHHAAKASDVWWSLTGTGIERKKNDVNSKISIYSYRLDALRQLMRDIR